MGVEAAPRRGLMVSRGWLQAVGVVLLVGFLIMGLLAYRTYLDEPPIPEQVVSGSGQVLFTGGDISRGQQVFLGNGLMEYGSVSATAPIWVRTSRRTICTGPPSPRGPRTSRPDPTTRPSR